MKVYTLYNGHVYTTELKQVDLQYWECKMKHKTTYIILN